MNEFEQMEHLNVQLEADLKRTKEKLQEAEHTKKVLQERVADLEAQNRELKEITDCVMAEKEVVTKDFTEKIEQLQGHEDNLMLECSHLRSELAVAKTEIQHYEKMYADSKKSFDRLYEGSKTVTQQLNDERTRNEELTTIIDSLSRTVHNLSSCLK